MTNTCNLMIEGNTPTLIPHNTHHPLEHTMALSDEKHALLHLSRARVFNLDKLWGQWSKPIDFETYNFRGWPGTIQSGHTHLTYSTSRSGKHF
mmetsp:Transcript_37707/g.67336  ORF Transcript_37707/g.67336 Transcript_37707/m.67336 type:complete len:93 (+) Transcript_37707:410-688(+)